MRKVTLLAARSDDPTRIRSTKYITENRLGFHQICFDRLYEIWITIVHFSMCYKGAFGTKRTNTITTVMLNKSFLKMLLYRNKQILCFCKRTVFFYSPKCNLSPILHSEIFEKILGFFQEIRKKLPEFTLFLSLSVWIIHEPRILYLLGEAIAK
jgi:hypothetical protein